jgi:hypothetical protein
MLLFSLKQRAYFNEFVIINAVNDDSVSQTSFLLAAVLML